MLAKLSERTCVNVDLLLDIGYAVVQVVRYSLTHSHIQTVHLSNESRHLVSTVHESRFEFMQNRRVCLSGEDHLLPLDVLQMFDGHLEDVGLFQFGVSCWL